MLRQTPATGSTRRLSEREKAAHILNRAGFGPKPGDVDRVLKVGIPQYVESQLYPERLTDAGVDRWESQLEVLNVDAKTIREKPGQPQVVLNQLVAAKLMRAIDGKRQLQESMTDFWFNHFNVNWSKEELRYLTPGYERHVIRRFALGKFPDLLMATARHPAMLVYLDNALSSSPNAVLSIPDSKPGINENYARELMELHTLGVDGGYTQKDVEEVARCFTGWTIDRDNLTFRYAPEMHDAGDKTVLGTRIPSSGYSEGETVLRLLASHPSTARFIATKLVRRLVSDDPPKPVVDRVSKVFTQSGGDIREMCRTIFNSAEFYDPATYRAKVKSPFEFVVSAIRAIGPAVLVPRNMTLAPALRSMFAPDEKMKAAAELERQRAFTAQTLRSPLLVGLGEDFHAYMHLVGPMQLMGHFIYQYTEPTGYPDRADFWLNGFTVLNRMTFAVSLAQNQIGGMQFGEAQLKKLIAGVAAPSSWESALGLITGVPGGRLVRMQAMVSAPIFGPSPEAHYVGLALGSPEFQCR